MVDKQRSFAKLLQQGVSVSEACRRRGSLLERLGQQDERRQPTPENPDGLDL